MPRRQPEEPESGSEAGNARLPEDAIVHPSIRRCFPIEPGAMYPLNLVPDIFVRWFPEMQRMSPQRANRLGLKVYNFDGARFVMGADLADYACRMSKKYEIPDLVCVGRFDPNSKRNAQSRHDRWKVRAIAGIRGCELYPVDLLRSLFGIGWWPVHRMRRKGLKTIWMHHNQFVVGRDIIAAIRDGMGERRHGGFDDD